MEPSRTNPFPKSDANGSLVYSDVEQTAEHVKTTTAQAIDRTTDAAASALDETAAKREQLRASQQWLMGNAAEYMHSYPLATIDLTFGADFLIDRLLGCNND